MRSESEEAGWQIRVRVREERWIAVWTKF
ncbi:hypothetical protein CK1_25920 [Ruminococcus sp. SR1/5]|nr:hypothetical protein CK1_25920 [Ruminococcus sp. SR1/5]